MSDVEKLRKQLKDLTTLYENEKGRADLSTQALSEFYRREPLVNLMWSEILLLRKLLETSYNKSTAVIDLPQQRASDRAKPTALSYRERLTTATLQLMKGDMTIDQAIATSGQSPTTTLQQQAKQREGPLGAGADVLSQQLQQSQQRIAQLEGQLGQMQHQYSTEIARLQGGGSGFSSPQLLNLTPSDGAVPPPPQDGAVASPTGTGTAASSTDAATAADGSTGSSASPGSSIPSPPVLPGFVGKGGPSASAGPSGGSGTVPGTNLPLPPVLAGFTAKYPGQGSSPAGGAGAVTSVAAAPPVDPGPQPTKTAVKPIKKMKALHWKPIITGDKVKQSAAAKSSIWSAIDGNYSQAVRDIPVSEFEEKFTSAPPKAKATGPADADAEAKALREANKPQRLLDPNRHNQLSIMLSKMPALPEMKKALLQLDSTVLRPEHIESMHKNMFTTEDVDTVKSSGLPKEKLLLPEQWILEMSTIPQLAARIECWRFSQVFNDDYVAVVRPLARLETTCEEIKRSQALRQFFTYILVIGNHLNGGTARGRADGFDIESLGKLFRIKDAEGTGTLIDYLVGFMQRKFGPDIVSQLRTELSTLPETKSSSLRVIAGEAKKLLGKINLTMKMQSLVLAQNIPGDRFEDVLGSFAADAEHKVKALDARATTALKAFSDAVKYLEPHLDPQQVDKVQSEEWFPLLEEFVSGIVQCLTNQTKRKEAAEREAKAAANMAALQAKAGKKPGDAGVPQVGQELGDNGFPKLRSAADRQQQPQNAALPASELQGGFPKLRSAADRQQGGNSPETGPVNELQGGFPKLRSAADRQQQQPVSPNAGPTNELQGGFPKLRSAGQPQGAKPLAGPDEGFKMPMLKKTETKTANGGQNGQNGGNPQTQTVSASEFDNVKRPTAKSNVFLKAQMKAGNNNGAPMQTAFKQQQQQMQQKQQDALPTPPEFFADDDGSDSDTNPGMDFFNSLELPPPPPPSDSD